MSWLDNFRWVNSALAPYDALALAKYREVYKLLPTALQSPLDQVETYYQWAVNNQDPRVKDWPLMNPFHNLVLVTAYLLSVFVLVQIMKRAPSRMPTKLVSMFHNIFCTALSVYMCVEIARQAIINRYNIFSNNLDRTPNGLGMATILWVFYASKVPEFFDTILMALNKNFRQISFLHVYHHASVFMIWWSIISYAPGGCAYFSAMLNSGVHVFMYGYYLWSSLAPKQDPAVKPRWTQPAFYKKYITKIQLLQFCLNFVQAVYLLMVPPTDFPMFAVWILFIYMITMLTLFMNFYIQTYKKKKPAQVGAAGAVNGATKKQQ